MAGRNFDMHLLSFLKVIHLHFIDRDVLYLRGSSSTQSLPQLPSLWYSFLGQNALPLTYDVLCFALSNKQKKKRKERFSK